LELAIVKELKQILLRGTIGASVFRVADVTKVIDTIESPFSRTKTDPVAEDVIATF
jgi:hypothetical protein